MPIKKLNLSGATIGNFNWLNAESLNMSNGSWIGRFNRIKHVNFISLGEEAIIQNWNKVFAPKTDSSELKETEFILSEQNLILGEKSAMLRMNYVDLTRSLKVGDNVVIGGNGSEFWTHGFDTQRNMKLGEISIEDNVFIGTKCIFNPGVRVTGNVIIAPGTVVYKNICVSGIYSSHSQVLVKKI